MGRVTPCTSSWQTQTLPSPPRTPIKAKTPIIVHDQGSSRQTVKLLTALLPPAPVFNLALGLQPLAFCFKTPAIKANRASSRQTPNSRSAPVLGRSNGQIRRPHHYPKDCQPPRPEIRFPAPIKAKTPAIVHNQGISRHPPKNTPSPWSLVVLWCLVVGIWSFPAPSPLRLCASAPSR